MIHLRAHLCELPTEKDFEKLRRLLGYVSEQVSLERLRSITIADIAGLETARIPLLSQYAHRTNGMAELAQKKSGQQVRSEPRSNHLYPLLAEDV